MLSCDTINRTLVDSACRIILVQHYRRSRATLAGGKFSLRLIHADDHLSGIICNQLLRSLNGAYCIGSHELIGHGLLLGVRLRSRGLFAYCKLVGGCALIAKPLYAALTLVTGDVLATRSYFSSSSSGHWSFHSILDFL